MYVALGWGTALIFVKLWRYVLLICPEIICKFLFPFLFKEDLTFLMFMLTRYRLGDINFTEMFCNFYIHVHSRDRKINYEIFCRGTMTNVWCVLYGRTLFETRSPFTCISLLLNYFGDIEAGRPACFRGNCRWNQKVPGIMITHSIMNIWE